VLQYDFEESIGYWIVLASHAFQRALNEELMPHGITFRQSQVLGWLALKGELTQKELAGRMMIEPATLVGVLERMERGNLIARHAVCGDRRSKLVRVHPQAVEIWERVAACARRVRARAAQGLSEQQLIEFRRTLRVVISNLHADCDAIKNGKQES
jgi:MarR family transcriptional regulator, transcriptional regulator for hemolysin